MPCFGTTDRTYNNAVKMTENGCTLREINIKKKSVDSILKISDIMRNLHNVT